MLGKCARVVALLAAASLVGGCGSGGGDSPAPVASTPMPAPTPIPPVDTTAQYAIQATEAASTYAAGSTKETVYKALGRVRGATFGYLNQSAGLDTAAQGHAAYVGATLQVGHTQVPGTPGFTGATLPDRVSAAGYSGSSTEVVGGINVLTGKAADYVPGMLSTLYHGQALLAPNRDIGVGVARDVTNTQDVIVVVAGIQTSAARQLPAAGTVKIYPLDAQTGVLPRFYIANEVPRPLPELATAGHPVYFSIDNVGEAGTGATGVTVQSASLKDAFGNLVPALLVTAPGTAIDATLASASRSDARIEVKNAYLVPQSPLAPQATYTASFQVKTATATYSKTWSFKTGDQN